MKYAPLLGTVIWLVVSNWGSAASAPAKRSAAPAVQRSKAPESGDKLSKGTKEKLDALVMPTVPGGLDPFGDAVMERAALETAIRTEVDKIVKADRAGIAHAPDSQVMFGVDRQPNPLAGEMEDILKPAREEIVRQHGLANLFLFMEEQRKRVQALPAESDPQRVVRRQALERHLITFKCAAAEILKHLGGKQTEATLGAARQQYLKVMEGHIAQAEQHAKIQKEGGGVSAQNAANEMLVWAAKYRDEILRNDAILEKQKGLFTGEAMEKLRKTIAEAEGIADSYLWTITFMNASKRAGSALFDFEGDMSSFTEQVNEWIRASQDFPSLLRPPQTLP